MSLPAKVTDRMKSSLKRFQTVLKKAKARDINESDTVLIITDMLEQIFGYDKYTEITSEHAIRNTFCDLAVNTDGDLAFLIEVKAIGLDLKENHIKQAVDYAANQGTDWVVLTNGIEWHIYKVIFGKPISAELVEKFDMLELSNKNKDHLGILGLLAKESQKKGHLEEHHSIKQIMNKHTLGAILCSDPVLKVIKRELKRISSDVKVSECEIQEMLEHEVIKREVLEGEKADEAKKRVSKAEKKTLRKTSERKAKKKTEDISENEAAVTNLKVVAN